MSPTERESAREQDAQARLRAQREFERPLVVEAGAGTGKTAVLTSRLVAWSLGPGWQRASTRRQERDLDTSPDAVAREVLSGVAAITFTEAAAAEMAVRIEQALRGVELGRSERWLDEEALPAPEHCQERARALREALDHLTVRTIHAWCRVLLARFPIAAKLHPEFEVDATGRIQAEALQRVLEQHLRRDYADGGPLLDLAALEQGPNAVYEALNLLIDRGVRARELDFDPLAPEAIGPVVAELRASFQLLAAMPPEGAKLSKVPAEVFPLIDWTLGRLDALEAAASEDAYVEALDVFTSELRERWEERRKQLRDWGRGEKTTQLCKALDVPTEDFEAAAARAHAPLDQLLQLEPRKLIASQRAFVGLLGDFERELARRSAVTYSDLLRGARDLVVEHPGIAATLRGELDLLLVDEFQDTDSLQCDVVRTLALDGPAGERPSLFVVGDPKQSIYGWRSADLAAYGAFVRAIEAEGGERLSLSVNFRSVPSVLEEVERVMRPVMIEQADLQPRFEPLLADEAKRKDPGFEGDGWASVEHWVSWQRPDGEATAGGARTSSPDATEIEARAFAQDVARLKTERGVDLSRVALLLRSRSDLDRYLGALREVGIRYVVAGERSYFARREVVDAIAGLRCVLDPNDHVALLTWIRSATVGVPDAALIPLWAEAFPSLAGQLHASHPGVLLDLAERVRRVAGSLPEGIPGLERIEGWEESLVASLAAIAELRASFEHDPPDRFVERLRTELAIEVSEAGRFPAAFRVANLERLYRELASELAAGADEHALLRRLRTAADRERDVDEPVVAVEGALQVMTIHGAKGLGFDHVYLAQAHKSRRRGGGPESAVERIGERLEFRLLGAQTLGLPVASEARELREHAEGMRTLYVALTRAKQRLVVMGGRLAVPGKLEAAGSAADLIAHREEHPELEPRFGELLEQDEASFDDGGARWHFPALEARAGVESARLAVTAADWPELSAPASSDLSLGEARRSAARRMERARSGQASSLGHAALREAAAERGFSTDPNPLRGTGSLDRSQAMAVGTAVHALLEDWDPTSAPDQELARQRERLPALLTTLGVPESERAAHAEAESILDGFSASPLFERFAELGDRIVARELSVLLAPTAEGSDTSDSSNLSESGPLESIAGAIDLVYRDDSGELVVVDYKTDRVASAEERAARAEQYAPQGKAYVDALAEGLGLESPPRFELWFLRDGSIATPLG